MALYEIKCDCGWNSEHSTTFDYFDCHYSECPDCETPMKDLDITVVPFFEAYPDLCKVLAEYIYFQVYNNGTEFDTIEEIERNLIEEALKIGDEDYKFNVSEFLKECFENQPLTHEYIPHLYDLSDEYYWIRYMENYVDDEAKNDYKQFCIDHEEDVLEQIYQDQENEDEYTRNLRLLKLDYHTMMLKYFIRNLTEHLNDYV